MPDYEKIAGPNATFISNDKARELLSAPSGERVRIYGLTDNQIVKIASNYYLDKYNCEKLWISNTTIADLLSRM